MAITGSAVRRCLAVLAVLIAATTPHSAQQALAPSGSRPRELTSREAAVRKELGGPATAQALISARALVSDLEAFGAQSEDLQQGAEALWRAAQLSGDTYTASRNPLDASGMTRLLQDLTSRYPSSPLAARARAQLETLYGIRAAGIMARRVTADEHTPAPEPAPMVPGLVAPAADAAAAPAPLVMVKGIRQTVVNELVRVELELDGEVAFQQGRLGNPERVYVDLPLTRIPRALRDRTFRFDEGADAVSRVRVWEKPNRTSRLIIEMAAEKLRCRAGTVSDPFRLIVDCSRPPTSVADAPPPGISPSEDLQRAAGQLPTAP